MGIDSGPALGARGMDATRVARARARPPAPGRLQRELRTSGAVSSASKRVPTAYGLSQTWGGGAVKLLRWILGTNHGCLKCYKKLELYGCGDLCLLSSARILPPDLSMSGLNSPSVRPWSNFLSAHARARTHTHTRTQVQKFHFGDRRRRRPSFGGRTRTGGRADGQSPWGQIAK